MLPQNGNEVHIVLLKAPSPFLWAGVRDFHESLGMFYISKEFINYFLCPSSKVLWWLGIKCLLLEAHVNDIACLLELAECSCSLSVKDVSVGKDNDC